MTWDVPSRTKTSQSVGNVVLWFSHHPTEFKIETTWRTWPAHQHTHTQMSTPHQFNLYSTPPVKLQKTHNKLERTNNRKTKPERTNRQRAKMVEIWPHCGESSPSQAARACHRPGGLAPHECKSGCCLSCALSWWCDGLPQCRFLLFFADLLFLVKSHIVYCRDWPTACSPTGALLHWCCPSNLSTTKQGAIVKLHRVSSELCTLEWHAVSGH